MMKKKIKKIMETITGSSTESQREDIAKLLKVSPDALDAFEEAYHTAQKHQPNGCLELSIHDIRSFLPEMSFTPIQNREWEKWKDYVTNLVNRIVTELLCYGQDNILCQDIVNPVTLEEINQLPEWLRPQLTGRYMKKDFDANSYEVVFSLYKGFLERGNDQMYHHFRQGLDICDLDPILWETINLNPDSIGKWFPTLSAAVKKEGFFLIPDTKIVKVPLPLLQLTRLEYTSLTPTTIAVVNKWAHEIFRLDDSKTYFIKTGTYSSKFLFQNAKVIPSEVSELGSYLLYIHFQALSMASPLSRPSIYGVSTTTEWCVRDYIEDVENNPSIYDGMPLHTEYRVFIDCDTDEVLDVVPYWDEKTMLHRFEHGADKDSPKMKHDSVIYRMHKDILRQRFEENKDTVWKHVEALLKDIDLSGHWSLDIMQNGTSFYAIDMATAERSALYDRVPKEKRKTLDFSRENWIPDINNRLKG